MVVPEDFDFEEEQAAKERAEFIEIAEDEQIAEGNISVSETVTGHDPTPDESDDDDDLLDEFDAMGMHIMDEEEFESLEDPFDEDGYIDDEDEDV